MSESDGEFHAMREPKIEKVVVHMGVGEGGHELQNAEAILEEVTGQDPVRTTATGDGRDFGVREGDPIGAKVTLRGEDATAFLDTAFGIVTVRRRQFDQTGNVSFGVAEHTDFPSQEYDPSVGIYGMDVTVNLVRPGYRVTKRDKHTRQVPAGHRLSPEDAIAYLEREYDVVIQ